MRQCKKCLNDKPLALFYSNKARKDGYDHYCKECRKKVSRNRNPKFVRERKQNNLRAWRAFFIEYYGADPVCAICNRNLIWCDGTKNEVVHWDHRYGLNECKQPYDWCASRECTSEHIGDEKAMMRAR